MGRLQQVRDIHLDLLKEIGNIGAGHAATALSKMIDDSIDMNVPSVKIVPFSEMTELVGGSETVVAAVFFRFEGDAPGNMFFMLPLKQASYLIKRLTGKIITLQKPPFDELAMSALQEVGNILGGSYISSLADFTNLDLQASVPAVGIDMAGALMNYGFIEISQESDYAIVIDTCFFEQKNSESKIKAQVLLLPDPPSFEKIFSALGVPFNE